MTQDGSREVPLGGSGAMRALVAYIDFKSANCRLALGPTLALANEVGALVDWRPFHIKPRPSRPVSLEASPTAKAPEASSATRPSAKAQGAAASDPVKSALHVRVRAEYRRREQALYARNQGIALRHPPKAFDGFAANAGLLWMRRQGASVASCGAYVTQVFTELWSGRMDCADADAVARAVSAAGGEGAAFGGYLAGPAQAELDALCAEARALGANDTPAFWIGGELYIGRQHLPVIRWWLTGQRGAPPV